MGVHLGRGGSRRIDRFVPHAGVVSVLRAEGGQADGLRLLFIRSELVQGQPVFPVVS